MTLLYKEKYMLLIPKWVRLAQITALFSVSQYVLADTEDQFPFKKLKSEDSAQMNSPVIPRKPKSDADPFEELANQKDDNINGQDSKKMQDSGHQSFKPETELFSHGQSKGNVQTGDNTIEIYGKAMFALATDKPNNTSLTSSGSRLGIRGNKSLGDQMFAFWQVESSIDFDNLGSDHGGNESQLAGRDSFVGISNNWGMLVLGKHNTPYKMSVHSWDPFNHVAGDFRAILGRLPGFNFSTDHHGNMFHVRAPNSVIYYPPRTDYFSSSFAMAAIDEAAKNSASLPILSASFSYKFDNFEFVFAHESHRKIDVVKGEEDHDSVVEESPHLIEKSYANLVGIMAYFESTMFIAIIEQILVSDDIIEGRERERFAAVFAINHKFSHSSIRASLGRASEFNVDDGATFISIGFFTNMAIDTTIYVNYAMVRNDIEGRYVTFNIEEAEKEVSSLSIGMIHSF